MIGTVGGNPAANTLFTTVKITTATGSGWFLSTSTSKTLSGNFIYIARDYREATNFFEI